MPDYQTVVMKVSMHSERCTKKVVKALQKIDGVEEYDVDLGHQKVTVMGRVDPKKLVKKVQWKTGKHTELWTDRSLSSSGRKSWRMGSFKNSFKRLTTVFSDEDPNACTIM